MQAKLAGTLAATFLVPFVSMTMLAATLRADHNFRHTTVVPKRTLAQADREGIRDTIRGQLRALATHDAGEAFAKLAPSAQHYFGKPDNFLQIMKRDLAPVVATKQFAFLGVEQVRNGAYQEVQLTNSDGEDWLARFQLERESAGDWRVKSYTVEVAPGEPA
jgi:hypothetical protein